MSPNYDYPNNPEVDGVIFATDTYTNPAATAPATYYLDTSFNTASYAYVQSILKATAQSGDNNASADYSAWTVDYSTLAVTARGAGPTGITSSTGVTSTTHGYSLFGNLNSTDHTISRKLQYSTFTWITMTAIYAAMPNTENDFSAEIPSAISNGSKILFMRLLQQTESGQVSGFNNDIVPTASDVGSLDIPTETFSTVGNIAAPNFTYTINALFANIF